MSCESELGEGSVSIGPTDRARGLCIRHATEPAAHLTAILPVNDRPLYPSTPGYWEAVSAVLDAERCDGCPTLAEDLPKPSPFSWARLGMGCAKEAREAADLAYPHLLPMLAIGFPHTDREREASWVAMQANHLIMDEWFDIVRRWPTCPRCPVPEPPKQKEAEKLRARVLDALALQTSPLSSSDLKALIEVTKDAFGPLMRGLVADELVSLTTKGPAKFYALA